MKIFQIKENLVYWDASRVCKTLSDAIRSFPGLEFTTAPDFVFEGWGYDANQSGDNRFIKPTPPEGWGYDDKTGTFYLLENPPAPPPPTLEERTAALEQMMLAMMMSGGASNESGI